MLEEEAEDKSPPFEFVPAERMSTSSLVGGIALTAMLFGLAGYALGYRPRDFTGTSEPSRSFVPAYELEPGDPDAVEVLEDVVSSTARDVDAAAVASATGSAAGVKYAKGYVVYSREDGTLWAAPFNRRRRAITGPSTQVGSQIAQSGAGSPLFSYSRSGNLAYIPEEPQWLVLVDRYGKLRNATPVRRHYYEPRFAPDSNHITLEVLTPSGRDLFVLSYKGGGLKRIPRPVAEQDTQAFKKDTLMKLPVVSPDRKWVAYVSDRSGRDEVYVRPVDGGGSDIQVSLRGGSEPVWSPDQRVLFYRGASSRGVDMIEASIRASPSFVVESRRRMFPAGDIAAGTRRANYDVTPDGRTFVMVRRAPSTRVAVLRNLPALLKSLRQDSGKK